MWANVHYIGLAAGVPTGKYQTPQKLNEIKNRNLSMRPDATKGWEGFIFCHFGERDPLCIFVAAVALIAFSRSEQVTLRVSFHTDTIHHLIIWLECKAEFKVVNLHFLQYIGMLHTQTH